MVNNVFVLGLITAPLMNPTSSATYFLASLSCNCILWAPTAWQMSHLETSMTDNSL